MGGGEAIAPFAPCPGSGSDGPDTAARLSLKRSRIKGTLTFAHILLLVTCDEPESTPSHSVVPANSPFQRFHLFLTLTLVFRLQKIQSFSCILCRCELGTDQP